jgi:hypothetical protein
VCKQIVEQIHDIKGINHSVTGDISRLQRHRGRSINEEVIEQVNDVGYIDHPVAPCGMLSSHRIRANDNPKDP